jgi:hypothetical protein
LQCAGLRRACSSANPLSVASRELRLFDLKSFARLGDIAGVVDRDSDAGVTAALQRALASILARTLALGSRCPCDMRFQGPDHSHAGKQHWSAIFGGVDQHLDGKPPFLTITFLQRKLPDVVGGVPQGLRRRPLRKWDRLIERTIPRHT